MPKALDDMVKSIKSSLRQSHPDWSEDKINSVAHATAIVRFKNKGGEK